MPPLSERQKKRARDKARAARWALENAPQAPTTTAPGGLDGDAVAERAELQRSSSAAGGEGISVA